VFTPRIRIVGLLCRRSEENCELDRKVACRREKDSSSTFGRKRLAGVLLNLLIDDLFCFVDFA